MYHVRAYIAQSYDDYDDDDIYACSPFHANVSKHYVTHMNHEFLENNILYILYNFQIQISISSIIIIMCAVQ